MRIVALRIAAIVCVLLVVVLAATSISRVPPLSGRFTTLSGEPLAGAYVAYRHRGSRFNFVDSLTYSRPGKVVQADDEGAYAVSGFLELHPPLDSGLVPWVEWVYVPELHHFFGPIARQTETIPGVMENEASFVVVRLADLTDDPERWSRTIRELDSAIRRSRAKPGGPPPHVRASEPVRDALRAHLHEEYRAFMQRHATTLRAVPETPNRRGMSEDERTSREREIREAWNANRSGASG